LTAPSRIAAATVLSRSIRLIFIPDSPDVCGVQ
jgi:hypothetical protein